MQLSPNFRFGALVSTIIILVALECALLFSISSNKPAAPVAQVAQVAMAPAPMFTVPGLEGETGSTPDGAVPPHLSRPSAGPAAPPGDAPGVAPVATPAPRNEAERAFQTATPFLQKGDFKGAVPPLLKSIQLDPKVVTPRRNLAVAYLQLKQPQKALTQLREIIKITPKDPAAHFQLAELLLDLRQPKAAEASLRTVIKLEPKARQAQATLAGALSQQGNHKAAYAVWTSMIKADPKDVEPYLAAAALSNDVFNKPAEAITWLKRSIQANPRTPAPALVLARMQMATKKPKEAATVLAAASKKRPDVFEIYTALADARVAAGDAKGAVAALQSALMRAPNVRDPKLNDQARAAAQMANGAVHLALGRVYGLTKQPEKAKVEFSKAQALLPADADGLGLLAQTQLQGQDTEGGIATLKKILAQNPERQGERRLLAQTLANNSRLQEASDQYQIYSQRAPKDASGLFEWAQVLSKLKKPEQELDVWDKMAKLNPKDPLPSLQRGAIMRDSGNLAAAAAEFRKALRLNPREPNALYEVAKLESSANKHTAAVTTWQALINVRPDFLPAYASLLESAKKASQSGGARTFVARKLSTKPENPETLQALDAVMKHYEKGNNISEAQALLEDVVGRNGQAKTAGSILNAIKQARAKNSGKADAEKAAP